MASVPPDVSCRCQTLLQAAEAKTETEAEVVLRRAHLLQQNTGSPSVDDTGSDPTFRAGHTGPTRLELATVAVVEPPTQRSSSSSIA